MLGGAMMMSGVTPAWLGFSAQSTGPITPAASGGQLNDMLFAIGADSGGFPAVADATRLNSAFTGGDAGGGAPWTMIGLRGVSGVVGRGSGFIKHPRHAGLVIIASIAPVYGAEPSVSVDGVSLPRAAGYYSAPSLENVAMSLFLRLYPQWPVFRDGASITASANTSATVYELLGG